MQAKTSFFVALFFILFLQTVAASQALAAVQADAGPDQTVNEGDTVTLDGSNSSHRKLIIGYFWQQTGGSPSVTLQNANKAKASFTAPQVGPAGTSLTFQLTVTYNFYGIINILTDTAIVNVRFVNDPPVADAGPDQNVDEETTVTLDGSNSFDPDDGIESYRWKQIAGQSVTLSNPQAAKPTFLAPNVGPGGVSFTFELTVTDYGSLQSTDTAIINVIWLNDPPTANAGTDQTVLEKSTVTLDGSESSDPDGDTVSYQLNICEDPDLTTGCIIDSNIVADTGQDIYHAGIGSFSIGLLLFGIVIILPFNKETCRKLHLFVATIAVTGMFFLVSCGKGGDNSVTSSNSTFSQEEITQEVSEFRSSTTYYWQIVADDGKGGKTYSDIWSFETK